MSSDPLLSLPSELRPAFKGPFGPVYSDVATLLTDLHEPIISVGDVVTWHLESYGHRPKIAVVDGRTEREQTTEEISRVIDNRPNHVTVANPPGTITEDLIVTLKESIAAQTPTTVVVDGEEDLATVPAVILAPVGTTVVYGQPGKGMVPVTVTEKQKATFRAMVGKMDGDSDRALQLLTT